MTFASPVLSTAALVGCISSTGLATLLQHKGREFLKPEIEQGLFGFNGALFAAGKINFKFFFKFTKNKKNLKKIKKKLKKISKKIKERL